MLLPGESISKYQRYAQQAPVRESTLRPVIAEVEHETPAEPVAPIAATFPEDEPIFAAAESVAEPLHEEHEDTQSVQEEPAEHLESASTSAEWKQEFRRPEEAPLPSLGWPGESTVTVEQDAVKPGEVEHEASEPEIRQASAVTSQFDAPEHSRREDETPVFAAPGTMEEETIDDEEAGTIHYEASSDEGFDEFEEETQAGPGHLNGDARETVAEIHQASMTDGAHPAEAAPAEGEEDSEELELEEAQAEAEALLDAEARGNGTVDARVEVRAPAATAGYTQRTQRPRPGHDRDRQGGPRDRQRRGGGGGGGRRFRRRENAPVPLISDLLKEGQEILVQIAKEPIGKKGARITSHIALPGRFLVYMPTVNHTGVSRKISSEEERGAAS